MKIFIGSTNPVKINATTNAASETWPEVMTEGFAVASGISEQPLSDEETKQGAINRAKAALQMGLDKHQRQTSEAEFRALGVGLEGGVVDLGEEMWSTVWAAVIDTNGNMELAAGARFMVPEKVAKIIREDGEMGPAVAQLLGEKDENRIKQQEGLIGILTNGFVDRTEEYQGIIKLALGVWYGRESRNKLLGK